jgi:hypothetical protein
MVAKLAVFLLGALLSASLYCDTVEGPIYDVRPALCGVTSGQPFFDHYDEMLEFMGLPANTSYANFGNVVSNRCRESQWMPPRFAAAYILNTSPWIETKVLRRRALILNESMAALYYSPLCGTHCAIDDGPPKICRWVGPLSQITRETPTDLPLPSEMFPCHAINEFDCFH